MSTIKTRMSPAVSTGDVQVKFAGEATRVKVARRAEPFRVTATD
jgi:hypothetical protein